MNPAEDNHYLRNELYELIQHDPSVFDFLQEATLDGIWYWDLIHPEHEWMSPEFWLLLGYSPADKQHLASEWQDLIHPDDLVEAKKKSGKTPRQSRSSLRSNCPVYQEK